MQVDAHITNIYNIISYVDTKRGNMEIYGVLEKNHIGRGVSRAQYDIFFKDPHIFPYYPSKCLHNEFILPMI